MRRAYRRTVTLDLDYLLATKIMPEPNSGCWLWTGYQHPTGYGRLFTGWRLGRKPTTVTAHRLVYELVKGPVPEGLCLDHLCRVRCCVNPDHLEPVTQAENNSRGVSLSALNARKMHCKRGHEFSPENTYIKADGARECLACRYHHPSYGRTIRSSQQKGDQV